MKAGVRGVGGGDGGEHAGSRRRSRRSYQRKVHEDLHAVSWSHVSHVVKVGGVRNHLRAKLRIPQHLPEETTTPAHK